MRIALVDDELQQLQTLRRLLQEALEKLGIEARCLEEFSSPEAFFRSWQPGGYDIILLDIYMGKENGVDAARNIRQQDPEVVLAFCTSSNEYAAESYEVGASYYLQKPFSEDKLLAMLRRLDLGRLERSRTIRLPDGYKCLLRKILYTEYSNHNVIFHMEGSEPHSVYMNHSEAENLLLHYRFFCCINKGSIVNLTLVKKITGSEFLMADGQLLPISRRRYKEVHDAYNRCRFEQMDKEVGI